MAKKYYQSKSDRMHESKGMKRKMSEGYYAGMDPRRRREYEDSGMIHEDHSAVANLPQGVKYHEWPNYGDGYLPQKLNDTARGIDMQTSDDHREMMKHLKPEKY